VSTKLAFYPPSPPTYSVRAHADSGGTELYIQPHARGYPRVPSARVEWIDVPRRKEGGGGTRLLTAFVAQRDAKGRAPARATLLFSHGNAVDLGQMLPVCRDLGRALKCNVLAYDYTGYGPEPPPAGEEGSSFADNSSGGGGGGASKPAAAAAAAGGGGGGGAAAAALPSASNALADIAAVFEFGRRRYGLKPEDTILYGQSVGSGPTVRCIVFFGFFVVVWSDWFARSVQKEHCQTQEFSILPPPSLNFTNPTTGVAGRAGAGSGGRRPALAHLFRCARAAARFKVLAGVARPIPQQRAGAAHCGACFGDARHRRRGACTRVS
jgi:hypothetical protein